VRPPSLMTQLCENVWLTVRLIAPIGAMHNRTVNRSTSSFGDELVPGQCSIPQSEYRACRRDLSMSADEGLLGKSKKHNEDECSLWTCLLYRAYRRDPRRQPLDCHIIRLSA